MAGTKDFVSAQIGGADPSVADESSVMNYLEKVYSGMRKPASTKALANFSTAEVTLQTAVQITGAGRLELLFALNGAADPANYGVFKVTLDGTVYCWGKTVANSAVIQAVERYLIPSVPQSGNSVICANNGVSANCVLGLGFNQTLKIELMSSIATHTAKVYWLHSLFE